MQNHHIAPLDVENRGLFLWQQDGAPRGREAEYRELARLLAMLDEKAPRDRKKAPKSEQRINQTIEDSFPASDPPGFNPGTAGSPEDGKGERKPSRDRRRQ